MKKFLLPVAVASIAMFALSGCSGTPDGLRMLDTYVSVDTTVYADEEAITDMKDTVIIDDNDDMRAFLYGSSSCPPVVERVLTDEKDIYLYLEDYGDRACTEDYGSYKQKIRSVSAGDFEKMEEVFLCTNDADCKPLDKVIFTRKV